MGTCVSAKSSRTSKPKKGSSYSKQSAISKTLESESTLSLSTSATPGSSVSEVITAHPLQPRVYQSVLAGTKTSDCQDLCFTTKSSENLLCGLFDGHGTYGKDVAEYCHAFFESRAAGVPADAAEAYLARLVRECDLQVNGSWTKVNSLAV